MLAGFSVLLAFWLTVGGPAAFVTLFGKTRAEREHAFVVLKHATRYGLGIGVMAAALAALGKAGLGEVLPHLLGR